GTSRAGSPRRTASPRRARNRLEAGLEGVALLRWERAGLPVAEDQDVVALHLVVDGVSDLLAVRPQLEHVPIHAGLVAAELIVGELHAPDVDGLAERERV